MCRSGKLTNRFSRRGLRDRGEMNGSERWTGTADHAGKTRGRQRPRTEKGAEAVSQETGEEPNGGEPRGGGRQTKEEMA